MSKKHRQQYSRAQLECIFLAIEYGLITFAEFLESLNQPRIDYQQLVEDHNPFNGEVCRVYLHRLASIVNKKDSLLIRKFNDGKIKTLYTGSSINERYLGNCAQIPIKPFWRDIQPSVRLISLRRGQLKMIIDRKGIQENWIMRAKERRIVADTSRPEPGGEERHPYLTGQYQFQRLTAKGEPQWGHA